MSIIDNPQKYRVRPYSYYNTNMGIDTSITNNYDDMNVKKLIELNNLQKEDPFYGVCDKGLNKINTEKKHVAMNGILYEKYAKHKNKQNVGFLGCSLILYYMESDNDFDVWYRTKDLHTLGYDYSP